MTGQWIDNQTGLGIGRVADGQTAQPVAQILDPQTGGGIAGAGQFCVVP